MSAHRGYGYSYRRRLRGIQASRHIQHEPVRNANAIFQNARSSGRVAAKGAAPFAAKRILAEANWEGWKGIAGGEDSPNESFALCPRTAVSLWQRMKPGNVWERANPLALSTTHDCQSARGLVRSQTGRWGGRFGEANRATERGYPRKMRKGLRPGMGRRVSGIPSGAGIFPHQPGVSLPAALWIRSAMRARTSVLTKKIDAGRFFPTVR